METGEVVPMALRRKLQWCEEERVRAGVIRSAEKRRKRLADVEELRLFFARSISLENIAHRLFRTD
jgi:hypothetical protein